MDLADKLIKSATVADLPSVGEIHLLTDGTIPPEYREPILSAFHEVADGKTLTELYRDTGVIRNKKDPAHHPRSADPSKEINSDDPDGSLWKSVRLDILMLVHPDEQELEELPTDDLKSFLTVLKAGLLRTEEILKARHTKPAPKRESKRLLSAEGNITARRAIKESDLIRRIAGAPKIASPETPAETTCFDCGATVASHFVTACPTCGESRCDVCHPDHICR
jgi:hypothetical protein